MSQNVTSHIQTAEGVWKLHAIILAENAAMIGWLQLNLALTKFAYLYSLNQ